MKRILVIDDDGICRRTVTALLEQSGYVVMQAVNGEDGVELALQNPPDLVVSDVVMPKLDGLGVLDKFKTDPKMRSIPFIFMTGMSEKEAAKRGISLDAGNVLKKPFALAEFLAKVKECLEMR